MPAAFQIKGSLFTLSVLQILSTDLEDIEKQITTKIKQAPQFFNNTPMVIELTALTSGLTIEFIENLTEMLRKHTLLTVGFRLPDQTLTDALQSKGFPIFKEGKNIPAPTVSVNKVSTSQHKIISSRVRSGQQVISQNGDLIILSSVSSGAELLASGNIHVYGTLRGRAVAGLDGDTSARIFCHKLEADLVSIAGQYKIFEEPVEPLGNDNNGYQIQLKDGTIMISQI
ncbi:MULTISPECIES: septum site-determining protein MinC [Cysteiniphilum]|uniref:Probable septum site-determining protein MinC n=1 Tax=Cysteiniphilum litorale TaxID=2056700 RepID=A0A8J3E7I9_9GAMM|nr:MULTISPECIES: septum site-determining protein MinC [Cysteiniphilum]GGF87946.1 putative septum site-determining protein MinC [Cysteiniphilum litorale]